LVIQLAINWQLGLLAILQIWQDLFLGVSLAYAGGRGEVVSLERGCWSKVVDPSFFLDFIDSETAGLGPR
jgi:hypothetical protein